MTSQQAELIHRLQSFEFDDKGAMFTFADRLSKENAWSRNFSDRAIEEYRRFLVLATTAGHPVSPSDAVDQVWHLHLLYTRSYWDDLCRNVLGRPLHHEPSSGGDDGAKFENWYGNTIESYRRFFQAEPPADIWPVPNSRKRRHEQFQRIDPSRYWVVPRTRAGQSVLLMILLAVLLALAGGCAPVASGGSLNPLDLRGPQFLLLYAVGFVIAMIIAALIRSAARGSNDGFASRIDLDPYEIAHLNGGADQVVNAAVASLVDRGLLVVNPADGTLRAVGTMTAGLHPLEMRIHAATSPTLSTRIRQIRSAARTEIDRIASRLKQRGLLIDDEAAVGTRALAALVALSVPAVGVIKIFVGLSRGKPVGFLLIACIVSTIVALACFARRPHRTRCGDRALATMQLKQARLRDHSDSLGPDLSLAVALFGLSAMSNSSLVPLKQSLKRDASSGFCSGFSGCGGSGCGSSCGGGGCGGGGCGGCGG